MYMMTLQNRRIRSMFVHFLYYRTLCLGALGITTRRFSSHRSVAFLSRGFEVLVSTQVLVSGGLLPFNKRDLSNRACFATDRKEAHKKSADATGTHGGNFLEKARWSLPNHEEVLPVAVIVPDLRAHAPFSEWFSSKKWRNTTTTKTHTQTWTSASSSSSP